jgi:hypothetical protein
MTSDGRPLSEAIDPTKPNAARRYNYWLGGKDNFQADRDSADTIEKLFPHVRTGARENRDFLRRAVHYLAAERGIRQFLDIGAGLPSANITDEVAQAIDPTSRIVYVDNDPVVMVHARALFHSPGVGKVAFIQADLREPAGILDTDARRVTITLDQPVAVILVAVLHFIPGDQAYAAVRTLMSAVPPGSFLALSHATTDYLPDGTRTALLSGHKGAADMITARTRPQVRRFFDDSRLTLVEPGLAVVSEWRRDPGIVPPPVEHVPVYGGVAYKPLPGEVAAPSARARGNSRDHAKAGRARPNQRTDIDHEEVPHGLGNGGKP